MAAKIDYAFFMYRRLYNLCEKLGALDYDPIVLHFCIIQVNNAPDNA